MKVFGAATLLTLAASVMQAQAWSCFCCPDASAQKAVYPTYDCGKGMSGVSYDSGGIFTLAHWYGLTASQKDKYESCCYKGGADYHCY